MRKSLSYVTCTDAQWPKLYKTAIIERSTTIYAFAYAYKLEMISFLVDSKTTIQLYFEQVIVDNFELLR